MKEVRAHTAVFLLAVLSQLSACSESANFRSPTPRVLPDYVRLPGLAPLKLGEAFDNTGYDYLLPRGDDYPPFLIGVQYRAPLNPQDSVERTWINLSGRRVKCVVMQRKQTYRAAFDSLTLLFGGVRPIRTDSSTAALQAVWRDDYVQWMLAGHWYPGVYPVMISVTTIEPVGAPFDSAVVETC